MAIGQGVLGASVLDVGELDRLGSRIEERERRRSIEHAEQLVDVLALHRTYVHAGMGLSTAAHVALLMGCSEQRATGLLADAQQLQGLGALETMRTGLLTVEQARAVIDVLRPVDEALAASLWDRLADRLARDAEQQLVRPPARLRELLNRWLIAADPDGYAERRRTVAKDEADVELWRRDHGLADLVVKSLPGADAQACVDAVEQHAQPTGPDDTRTAGERRRDALRDLLLGRITLPFGDSADTGCCPAGSAAPCGAQIYIHVPLDTVLGAGTEPAELVGHGPLDPNELEELLTSSPVLHRVWVDANGTPVAVDDRTWRPGRGDPPEPRQAVRDLATGPPPQQHHPVHPGTLHRPHLADPGSYRPSRRHKALLRARAPRCEWPGCGRRASRGATATAGCDLDHDLAWPHGPTCPCNLGPLCRRHHRIKQLGWTKQRRPDGSIRWTSPTGRSWTSPNQHRPPPVAVPRRQIAPGVWKLAA